MEKVVCAPAVLRSLLRPAVSRGGGGSPPRLTSQEEGCVEELIYSNGEASSCP